MANPSRITDFSVTAANNAPAGDDPIGTNADDLIRAIQASVRGDLAHKGSDIASAATTDLGAVQGLMHDITGTTAITSFGTVAAGVWKILKFEGALTLTHNSTSLILPGGANITTADGDVAIVVSEGSGNWRCVTYFRAAAVPFTISALTEDTSPDLGADYVATYDNSASAYKKVLLGRLGAGVLGTEQASTSGTSIDFTSIPSWAKKITIQFVDVSTSGTDAIMVQIGDSGGVEATGYNGTAALHSPTVAAMSSGFLMQTASVAAATYSGHCVLTLEDAAGFTWVQSGILSRSDGTAAIYWSAGSKSLSAALDRIRVTTTDGTDTFDAGSINILYE